MTAIGYPDLTVHSASHKLRLEARSPHNAPGANQRAFQSEFVYTLYEGTRALWSRTQAQGEDSPHDAWVSERGWVVVRTHGPVSAGLFVLSPAGELRQVLDVANGVFGREDPEVSWTTAGPFWSSGALATHFVWQESPHFVVRTRAGRRIGLDLEAGRSWGKASPEELVSAGDEAVLGLAREILSSGDPLYDGENVRDWTGAVIALGWLGSGAALERLGELEHAPFVGLETSGDHHLTGGWLAVRVLRLLVQQAIRRLGGRPNPALLGFASPSLEALTPPADRREAARRCAQSTKPKRILEILGVPDHVGSLRGDMERKSIWEYDFLDEEPQTTLRLTFSARGRVVERAELTPPPWRDDPYRELEWL